MGGLLYKDFVAVRGKKLVCVLLFLTVLFIALRVMFPGTAHMKFFRVTNEAGESLNMLDIFFFQGEFCILWCGGFYINTLGAKILELDEKNRIRSYLAGMPFAKRTYIASKYVFVGIMAYAVFSLWLIWHITCVAFMGKGFFDDLGNLLPAFSIPFLCLILLVESFELPMFLLMGKGRAMLVKVSFALMIALLAIGYLLFGDLTVFEKWDISRLIDWIDSHVFELTLFAIVSPFITLAVYYGSYRIAAGVYEKREVETDE